VKNSTQKEDKVFTHLIGQVLKQLMEEHKISLSDFSRKIGIGYPTLYQILESKNVHPRVSTLIPILKYFNITLEQLIGEEPLHETHAAKHKKKQEKEKTLWSHDLYLDCTKVVSKLLKKREGNMELPDFIKVVREIYAYSISNKLSLADERFAKWYCEHQID